MDSYVSIHDNVHMHTIADLLDAASVKLGYASDYRLAKHLRTSSQNISRWRSGQVVPSNEIIVPLAQLIGIDPRYTIACMVLSRGDSNTEYWKREASAECQAAAIKTVNSLLEKTAAAYESKAQEYLARARQIRARNR
jgi:transcriptional regulator with XRE-family HTH domain